MKKNFLQRYLTDTSSSTEGHSSPTFGAGNNTTTVFSSDNCKLSSANEDTDVTKMLDTSDEDQLPDLTDETIKYNPADYIPDESAAQIMSSPPKEAERNPESEDPEANPEAENPEVITIHSSPEVITLNSSSSDELNYNLRRMQRSLKKAKQSSLAMRKRKATFWKEMLPCNLFP